MEITVVDQDAPTGRRVDVPVPLRPWLELGRFVQASRGRWRAPVGFWRVRVYERGASRPFTYFYRGTYETTKRFVE